MKKINKLLLFLILSVLFFLPSAYADVVWPALFLEQRIVSWWAITIGLLVEYLFVRKLTSFPVSKSIFVTIIINFASTLLGIILIPAVGFGWEFFPGSIIYEVLNVGTFNPVTWIATFLLATAINSVIETLVLIKFFKTNTGWRRTCGLMYLANSMSVGLAFFSLFIFPARF